jgi:hypothetical protein
MCSEQNCHLERVEMMSFSLLVLGLSAVCALPVTKVAENVTESSQKNGLVMSTNGKSYTKIPFEFLLFPCNAFEAKFNWNM